MTRSNLFRVFLMVVFCGWVLLSGTAQAGLIATPVEVATGDGTNVPITTAWTTAQGAPFNTGTDLLLNHLAPSGGVGYVGSIVTNSLLANINDGLMISGADPMSGIDSLATFSAGGVLTFTLDGPYDINQIDAFTAQQGLRVGQKYTLEFHSNGVWGPANSVNLNSLDNRSWMVRRVRLTDSSAGAIATGVDAMRFTFDDPLLATLDGGTYGHTLYSCYSEIAAYGTPSTPAPEPSTVVLVVTGLIGLLAYAWKKRR